MHVLGFVGGARVVARSGCAIVRDSVSFDVLVRDGSLDLASSAHSGDPLLEVFAQARESVKA